MTSFRESIIEAKVEQLYNIVETGTDKFICFTRYKSDQWMVAVTDGFELWKLDLDAEELEAHRDLANINSTDAYLNRFRDAFLAGDIHVTQIGVKATLTVGKGVKALTFELYEAKALEKRTILQNILFQFAETAKELEGKLEKTNKTVESMKTQRGNAGGGIFDIDLGKKKNNQKVQTNKAGMSVINPGTKKRKVAKGVEFD